MPSREKQPNSIALVPVNYIAAKGGQTMKILIVLTSNDKLGGTGERTGVWLEEFVAPYYVFKSAGAKVVVASPLGGNPPIDPRSDNDSAQTTATARFHTDPYAQSALVRSTKLSTVSADDFDAVFFPGGHGLLWDLVDDTSSIALIERFLSTDKPVATVCQGTGALRNAKSTQGHPVVQGHNVTGSSTTEEQAVGLVCVLPFLIEDMLVASGGIFSKAGDWQPHVVSDGLLVTGQNPASSQATGRALVQRLFMHTSPEQHASSGHAGSMDAQRWLGLSSRQM